MYSEVSGHAIIGVLNSKLLLILAEKIYSHAVIKGISLCDAYGSMNVYEHSVDRFFFSGFRRPTLVTLFIST